MSCLYPKDVTESTLTEVAVAACRNQDQLIYLINQYRRKLISLRDLVTEVDKLEFKVLANLSDLRACGIYP